MENSPTVLGQLRPPVSARPKKGQQGHNPKATTFSLFGQVHAHSKLASRPQTEARNQGQHSFKLIRHGYMAKAKAKHQKALEALSHQKPRGFKALGLQKPKGLKGQELRKPKGLQKPKELQYPEGSKRCGASKASGIQ